jgi:hypothetical protein
MALPGYDFTSLDSVTHPRWTHAKLSRQCRERKAQLPHGPITQQAPGGHLLALAPLGHNISLFQLADFSYPLHDALKTNAASSQIILPRVTLVRSRQNPFDEFRLSQDPLIAL